VHDLREDILSRCRDLGFAVAGVCDAAPIERAPKLFEWLEQGKHGEMEWMKTRAELRADPSKVLPGARGVIMVGDLVKDRNEPPTEAEPGKGRIARYAQGRDYHKTIKKRLHVLCDELRGRFPDEAFRAFVDTAPVMERELALRAGLGWIGKHTLLIHPRLGSHLLLGGVLTTLPFERPGKEPDHCGECSRCIDACPTGAIEPWSVDARRCISYLTIEHRTEIAPELAARTDDWVFGCDVCQSVCPHNSPRAESVDVGEMNPDYAPRRTHFDLLEVLGWTEEDRRRASQGSAIKRAKLEMMHRNASLAAEHDERMRGG
jgi:epoxyqueuosine reductase